MAVELRTAVASKVAAARRRLILQRFLHTTAVGTSVGLAAGLVWFLAEPWLVESPPEWLRWTIAGSLTFLGVISALFFTYWKAPSRGAAALELDHRFDLKERVTTALSLTPDLAATSAGQAVLGDAAASIETVRVKEKFPVRPTRASLLVPTLAAAIAAAFFFYAPDTRGNLAAQEGDEAKKKADAKLAEAKKDKPATAFTKPRTPEQDRKAKSPELKDLENQMEKLMEKWAKEPAETPEKQREKVTELTKLEEKLKKFEMDKAMKLEQLESKLNKLDKLNQDKDFADGPAKEFNESLSKGDLKKAQEDIDELKKKAKDKNLNKDEQAKLEKQLEKMKEEAQRLARNQEQQEKLKEKIEKAKQEGRDKDAESLQRELEKVCKDCEGSGEKMEQLAEKMAKMQQALKNGDLEELAEQLESMKGDIQKIEEELKDINDADESLQRLKDELKKACKGAGECKGDKPGEKDYANGHVEGGAGKRDENKDAKTNSTDERIKGLFDPKGKKSYGGSTRGPAFSKRSTVEMGQDIQSAVQEASRGLDSQAIPRDAKAAVKEYMEKIGGGK